ncbi:MAG: 6-bladed beta-propeller [Bacteroidetes bacterium]|nr:6-bladed beta-propeller [Bacteroidota bacterium]
MSYKLCTPSICMILLVSCTGTDPEQKEIEADQIVLEEILSLGDESKGDTILFGSLDQIAVNGRGDIFVAESRPWQVHAFAADGTYLTPIGAEGQGPGEYQYGFSGPSIGPADSVYLWVSWPQKRIQIYDPEDFSFVRNVHVHLEETDLRGIYPLIGAIENGWIMSIGLHSILSDEDGAPSINDDTVRELIVVNREGIYSSGLLGIMRRDEGIYHVFEDKSGFTYRDIPFARATIWAFGADGILYYGWNDTFEINFVSADGSTRGLISHDYDPVPITEAELAEALDTDDPLTREIFNAYDHHESKPAFQAIAVDEASQVWAKLSTPEGGTRAVWLVLDRDSQVVGKLTLPVAVDLKVVQGSYAYGIEQGAGLPPMVVVYEIRE